MHIRILKNKAIPFQLHVQNKLENKNLSIILNRGSVHNKVAPKVTQQQNTYVLEHTFNTPGRYDAHITVADTIIATYVVRVKRK
ncbi:hypothetical protein [Maribacter antarcticus]|uniref:hypothetical protein n=1 Tax=Maribacter antarcticus TaxID=505250 RepID=UPI00047A79F9|nr:hypothetical protein [Maribacter antarcticus]